jgi:peptidoglycan/xylan/chitin deacetylase (PgdA/CDA1 family)
MRAVMYHYVRKPDSNFPYFRFLDLNNFQRQLDYFGKEFGFVGPDEWEAFFIDGIEPSVKGKIILTFDDAMRDHFECVFDELVARKLWGIFYVPTRPYSEGLMLDVHKTHLLSGAVKGKDLFGFVKSIISEDMISNKKRDEFRKKTYLDQNNYAGITEVKRLLNYFVDCRYRSETINKVCENFSVSTDPKSFYISENNISTMENNGMVIGSHTVNHPVMSTLSLNEQSHEVSESFNCLSKICSLRHKTYCHPYGGFNSFNEDTISVLNNNDVDYSFNVESRKIGLSDIKNGKHHLPRFDCNEFPFGKAS